MNNKVKIVFYSVLILLLLAACSKKEEEEPVEQPNPPTEKPPVEEPVTYAAPFTGIEYEEEKTMRPVLVTINNDPKARPQSGLNDADIVYELMTEGNTTRFLALFQSHLPEEIGPVRSARDYFLKVAKELDAFYVAHGYSPGALTLLQAGYVDHVNGMQYDGTLFKRSAERVAPHNSYISGENILSVAKDHQISMEIAKSLSLSFHESIEDAKIGDKVSSFDVQQGSLANFTSAYTYDENKGVYTRSVNEQLTIDKVDEQPIELANVLVVEAEHQAIDAQGRQSVNLDAGGKGLLFQAGVVAEVEWQDVNGLLTPIKNGAPVKFVTGKTWIHVVPESRGIESIVSYTPAEN